MPAGVLLAIACNAPSGDGGLVEAQDSTVARARELAGKYPHLELCGSAYDGVAFPAAVASAERAAERILGKAAPAQETQTAGGQ